MFCTGIRGKMFEIGVGVGMKFVVVVVVMVLAKKEAQIWWNASMNVLNC